MVNIAEIEATDAWRPLTSFENVCHGVLATASKESLQVRKKKEKRTLKGRGKGFDLVVGDKMRKSKHENAPQFYAAV